MILREKAMPYILSVRIGHKYMKFKVGAKLTIKTLIEELNTNQASSNSENYRAWNLYGTSEIQSSSLVFQRGNFTLVWGPLWLQS